MSTEVDSAKKISNVPGPMFVTNGGFEGEVNMQWDAIKNASRYIIQVSKNGYSWQQVDIVSDPQYSLNGLKSGNNYHFRYCAVYQKRQGSWCEPVYKKVK